MKSYRENMRGYLNWNQRVDVRPYDLNYVVKTEDRKNEVIINESAFEVITFVNGQRTLEEIYQELCKKYNDELQNVKEVVDDCIMELSNKINLKLHFFDEKQNNKVYFHEEKSILPRVASVEITSKCNLHCRHCYGEFGDDKASGMDYQNISLLLNDLKDIGVEIVELTGGDVTMHKDLYNILAEAVRLDFKKIGVLTNGFILNDEIINYIILNNEKIFMQIDVHSLRDEYNYWFTQSDFKIEKLKDKINYLTENGVTIRIATVFTKRNLKEFFEIGEYVKSLNQKWGISPVEPLGRAVFDSDSNDLYLDIENAKLLNKNIINFTKNNPDVIFAIPEEKIKQNKNCGALSNHVVINTNGDIKLCTMDNLNYCNTSIGNVFKKSIRSIYEENKEIILAISRQSAPTEDSMECTNCEYKYSCMRCILRTLINIKNKNFRCEWYYKNFNSILKSTFYNENSIS